MAILVLVGHSVESTEKFDTLDAKAKAAQKEKSALDVPFLACDTRT